MPIQHISKLSADDFQGIVGQSFQVPFEDEIRMWVLRDVETNTVMMAPDAQSCAEGEEPPAKAKLDKRTQTKLAKSAVNEINANLDAIGYTGPKVTAPIKTVTLGFEGEVGKTSLPEAEYSLFNEALGTIEGALVTHTVRPVDDHSGITETAPLYDVTYTLA